MSAPLFDTTAPKKATNLSVNSDLLRQAKALGLNLSQLREEQRVDLLRQRCRAQWCEESQAAIQSYNERIEEQGVFSEGLRRF